MAKSTLKIRISRLDRAIAKAEKKLAEKRAKDKQMSELKNKQKKLEQLRKKS